MADMIPGKQRIVDNSRCRNKYIFIQPRMGDPNSVPISMCEHNRRQGRRCEYPHIVQCGEAFVCTLCPYGMFSQRYMVEQHVKRLHPTEPSLYLSPNSSSSSAPK